MCLFVCLSVPYVDHFRASGLSVFNNFWNSVHDFDSGTGSAHWSIVRSEAEPDFHQPPPEVANAGVSLDQDRSAVPYTVGSTGSANDEVRCVCVCVFFFLSSSPIAASEQDKELVLVSMLNS